MGWATCGPLTSCSPPAGDAVRVPLYVNWRLYARRTNTPIDLTDTNFGAAPASAAGARRPSRASSAGFVRRNPRIGARRVEPPIRQPPRKNQKRSKLSKWIGQSESAHRDLSISAIKKFCVIFDRTGRTAPPQKAPPAGVTVKVGTRRRDPTCTVEVFEV